MVKKLTKEEFVEKAKNIHGDRYSYENVNYVNAHERVEIYCNSCKESFPMAPYAHTNKEQGCYNCSLKEKSFQALENRLNLLKKYYDSRYTFPDISFTRNNDYITVKCNIHDKEYTHQLSHFILGKFKPSCCNEENRRIKRFNSFYNKLSEYHRDKYTYDVDSFKTVLDPIIIYCPIHGKQLQKPSVHLKGHECYHCGQETKRLKRITPVEEFKERASQVHQSFYTYEKVNYNTLYDTVIVTCPIHKDFEVIALNHLKGAKCRGCSSKYPRIYSSFSQLLDKYNLEYLINYRPIWLQRKELDIYIPKYNLAIEYNGSVYHHSSRDISDFLDSTYKSPTYHKWKYDKCKENSVDLIHIFEFEDLEEWLNNLETLFQYPDEYKVIFKNTRRVSNNLVYYGLSIIEIKNILKLKIKRDEK